MTAAKILVELLATNKNKNATPLQNIIKLIIYCARLVVYDKTAEDFLRLLCELILGSSLLLATKKEMTQIKELAKEIEIIANSIEENQLCQYLQNFSSILKEQIQ